jgi:tRNA dimethylallyltransferase
MNPVASSLNSWLSRKSEKPRLLVILGPTASGKTALSLKLARALHGEIISADSRQVYREINIGSDKPALTRKKTSHGEFLYHDNIPHHLIDFVPFDQVYTVGDFKQDAERIIGEIHARGHLPMLVGGTGLYIRAITENYDLPRIAEHERYNPFAHGAKNRIRPPKSVKKLEPKYDIFTLGITLPRDELYRRIEERVDAQFTRGLEEESRRIIEKYGRTPQAKNLPSISSLGLKEFIPYIEGKISLDQAAAQIKRATRQYAKRQLTWFRKDKNVHSIESHKLDELFHAILPACPSLENTGS